MMKNIFNKNCFKSWPQIDIKRASITVSTVQSGRLEVMLGYAFFGKVTVSWRNLFNYLFLKFQVRNLKQELERENKKIFSDPRPWAKYLTIFQNIWNFMLIFLIFAEREKYRLRGRFPYFKIGYD